jgi:O-antigen biosynthesis protein
LNICIVTPDLVGPIRNGGIGTHCYHLARVLAKHGKNVAILFTGPFEAGSFRYWRDYYQRLGITLLRLDYNPKIAGRILFHELSQSIAVDETLRRLHFDIIHFQCWQGLGFIPTQAKSVGLRHSDSVITETLHATEAWNLQGMKRFPGNPVAFFFQDYMEKYSLAHSDFIISPTQHMFDWTSEKEWRLADNRRLVRYPFLTDEQCPSAPAEPDPSHLIFFGRVETRKGFEVFLKAFDELHSGSRRSIKQITILGKAGELTDLGQSPWQAIEEFKTRYPQLAVAWMSDLDHNQAWDYIRRLRGVLIIPSLLDNSPFTVIEAISFKVPFIASTVGGIPEIVGDRTVLFDPTPGSLAARIEQLPDIAFDKIQYAYSPHDANMQWLALHDEFPRRSAHTKLQRATFPKVSICIAHRNMPFYLDQLFHSLASQDYPNLEVICVDGSDSDLEALSRVTDKFAHRGWKIEFSKERSGPSAARNRAAELASGEYLIFMDADNIAKPGLVSRMVTAMDESGKDCLTCYLDIFETDEDIGSERPGTRYCPMGPCMELAPYVNVLGDTNFIIRKNVFDALGGFPKDNPGLWEDWEFLTRAVLHNYQLDVIPEALFWYRRTDTGLSKDDGLENDYLKRQFILRPWIEKFPNFVPAIIMGSFSSTIPGNPSRHRDGTEVLSGVVKYAVKDYLVSSRFHWLLPPLRRANRFFRGIKQRFRL